MITELVKGITFEEVIKDNLSQVKENEEI